MSSMQPAEEKQGSLKVAYRSPRASRLLSLTFLYPLVLLRTLLSIPHIPRGTFSSIIPPVSIHVHYSKVDVMPPWWWIMHKYFLTTFLNSLHFAINPHLFPELVALHRTTVHLVFCRGVPLEEIPGWFTLTDPCPILKLSTVKKYFNSQGWLVNKSAKNRVVGNKWSVYKCNENSSFSFAHM